MSLWSKKVQESKLKIENGVLMKCDTNADRVTIPDGITAIDVNAFKDCKDIKINYSEEFITKQLAFLIELSMKSTMIEFSEEKRIIRFEDSFPSLKVCNMTSEQIEKAIQLAYSSFKEKYPTPEWKLTVIDADEILSICDEIRNIGRDNLTKEEGDSISTFKNIPFLFHYPVRELGKESERANSLIAKEGFGFLHIKNLNVENNSTLPENFMYNLIKGHSFDRVRLSPKWGVILDVGEGVKLDAPGDVGKWFDGNIYRNLTPEKFMKDMERKKMVVKGEPSFSEINPGIEPEKGGFSDFFEDTEDELTLVQNNQQMHNNRKDIDWEERHFQICLALLGRDDLDNRNPTAIILRADKMIEALKKHNQEQNPKN